MFVRSFHFISFHTISVGLSVNNNCSEKFFFLDSYKQVGFSSTIRLLVMFMSFFHDIFLCVYVCSLFIFFSLYPNIFFHSPIYSSSVFVCVYVFIEKKGSFTSLYTPKIIIIIIIIVVYTQHIHFFFVLIHPFCIYICFVSGVMYYFCFCFCFSGLFI